jgi:hypothetical protein
MKPMRYDGRMGGSCTKHVAGVDNYQSGSSFTRVQPDGILSCVASS